MHDLTLYRHSIFTHQTGEVAVSEPATPTVELECECPDHDPWRATVHYAVACPLTPKENA